MKTPEEIKKGLEYCHSAKPCADCSYDKRDFPHCVRRLLGDALDGYKRLESEKWDLFFEITAACYGKKMYGLNDDGTVYSRHSCETMTFGRAVDEFKELISGENT